MLDARNVVYNLSMVLPRRRRWETCQRLIKDSITRNKRAKTYAVTPMVRRRALSSIAFAPITSQLSKCVFRFAEDAVACVVPSCGTRYELHSKNPTPAFVAPARGFINSVQCSNQGGNQYNWHIESCDVEAAAAPQPFLRHCRNIGIPRCQMYTTICSSEHDLTIAFCADAASRPRLRMLEYSSAKQ